MPDLPEYTELLADLRQIIKLCDSAAARAGALNLKAQPAVVVSPPPPPVVTIPSNVINVTTAGTGVVPNAPTDQQAQIQRAIDNAPSGSVLYFPAGDYRHSGRITVSTGVTIQGDARKSRLLGTTPNAMAFHLRGSGSALQGLLLEGVGTRRLADWESCGVVLFGTDQAVRDCTVLRSSAAGIHVEGATRFRVEGSLVKDTLSDSIHCTGGANNGRVELNTVDNSGDDCLAVVSYGGQTPCKSILVRSNTTRGGKARGASVVGGEDITIDTNNISGTRAAGIYIASEPSYNTEASKRVTILRNKLTGCNTDPSVRHGGIFIWGGRADRPVDVVSVFSNEIRDTVSGAAHIVAQGSNIKGLACDSNQTFGPLGHDYVECPIVRTGAYHNGVRVPNLVS